MLLLNTDNESAFTVEPGMRVAQLLVVAVADVELVETDEVTTTDRGVGGFGSSGLR